MATVIFLTSGSSWTVPVDFDPLNNFIECVGAGAGGSTLGGGGQGGGYSRKDNVNISPGSIIPYGIGSGGPSNTAGGDSWFHGSGFSSSVVGAKGGAAPSGVSGGDSDHVSLGRGVLKYKGGTGGNVASSNPGGGGASAGPNGHGNPGSNGLLGLAGDGGVAQVFTWQTQQILNASAGPGSGGNGSILSGGADGELYGGAGGGSLTAGGSGKQGIIVITYQSRASSFDMSF